MKPKPNQNKGKKRKREKIHLVFDEGKRKDFLLGFRKRKEERRRKAHEDIKEKFKEEKRRIKQESKEAYKHLIMSHKPLPELEDILREDYEAEDVSVKVVELSTDNMKGQSRWIGANQPQYEEDKESSSEDEAENLEEVPGMDLKRKPPVKTPKPEKNIEMGANIKKQINSDVSKKLQKTKAFKMKINLERTKNKKASKQDKKRQERNQKKGKFKVNKKIKGKNSRSFKS